MGGGFAGQPARQHPDLTDPIGGRAVLWTVLALDGVLSAVLATFFLPLRIGTVPFPVSALASGLLNAALVWVGLQWAQSARLAAISLWAWLLTVAVFTLGGPGGDVMFGASGLGGYAPLILLILGAGPPALVLWRHSTFAVSIGGHRDQR